MKNLLYYPNFEIHDIDWLKFALLTFKDIKTIIPREGESTLSDNYKRLEDLGFFSKLQNIDFRIQESATEKSITCVDSLLTKPENYFHIFKTADLRKEWEKPQNWNIELYSGKFHWDWKNYVLKNKLGRESKNGVVLNGQLSHVYMSTLAHIIADCNNQPCVTDILVLQQAFMEK